MIERVGRSLKQPRVVFAGDRFVARYFTRERVVLTARDIREKYAALPSPLLVRSMQIEAGLIKRFADQADDYAAKRFNGAALYSYYRSLL